MNTKAAVFENPPRGLTFLVTTISNPQDLPSDRIWIGLDKELASA